MSRKGKLVKRVKRFRTEFNELKTYELEFQNKVEKDKSFKQRNNYIEAFKKGNLNDEIFIYLSKGSSFSLKLLVVLAETLEKKKMPIYVAVDKKSDPFPCNVKKVEKNSDEIYTLFAKCRYILVEDALPAYFIKKDNQTVIHTLAGIIDDLSEVEVPLNKEKAKYQRTLLQCSYLVGKPGFSISKLLERYSIDRIFKGNVLEHYNYMNRFSELIKANEFIELENFKVPAFIKKTLKSEENSKIRLFDIGSGNFINHMDALASLLTSVQDIFPMDRVVLNVNPAEYSFFEKSRKFENYLIGINRVVEPWFDNIVAVYSDFIPTLNEYKDLPISCNELIYENEEIKLHGYVCSDDWTEKTYQWTNSRETILIYGGGFYNNGITSSMLNLSNSIDHDKYNLIILERDSFDEASSENIRRLSSKVNLIQRWGVSTFDVKEQAIHTMINSGNGYRKWMKYYNPLEMYKREIKRFTGTDTYDYAIDFGGYSSYYTALIASVESKQNTIFLHNDMYAETKRLVKGEYIMKDSLTRIFLLYHFFDKVACVSDHTRILNQKNLKKYVDPNKFHTVNNLINAQDILNKLDDDTIETISLNSKNMFAFDSPKTNQLSDIDVILAPSNDAVTFIMAGRLSPEKAHKKMLKAAAKVKEVSNYKFEILVLGDGPIKEELIELRDELELQNIVHFIGQVSNPYIYFEQSDAFLMSSDHEGQPMVLLEAMTVGIPIIATDIAGNRSVLEGTNETLVENTVEGVIEGILDFMDKYYNHSINKSDFNIHEYNRKTVNTFYEVALEK